jgi:hypothetical protein
MTPELCELGESPAQVGTIHERPDEEWTCPSAEEIVNFTLGLLDDSARAIVAIHVARCPDCHAEVVTLQNLLGTRMTKSPR